MNDMRSLLFVPAEERRLAKIGKTNADAYIIDLEDSIDEKNKDIALEETIKFLNHHFFENLFVRINKDRHLEELKRLQNYSVGFVLPKMQSDKDYSDANEFLQNRKVIVLIESSKALMNINLIAAIPWIYALAFGAEDFTATSGFINDNKNLFVPKSMVSIAAKAYEKFVYDSPCFKLHDNSELKEELTQAIGLGYDGKLAIHPKQIDLINRSFQMQNINYLEDIVNRYDQSGKSVCEIDGFVYEKMHIDNMRKKIIKEKE